MREEHDINLPADADDLSRHAPVLFSLKNTEEGFVVPELYFSHGDSFGGELSELVIAKTMIPEEGGLVVPENYFEELLPVVEAKIFIPETDGLMVPENYFEELPSMVEAKTKLPDFGDDQSDHSIPENYFESLGEKIEARLELPAFDSEQDDDTIPPGYFDQLDSRLKVHIALDNVKQDEGFAVPQNYFENLAERVLAQTALDSNELHNDEVPAGYFDSFPDKVAARLGHEQNSSAKEERGRVIVFAQWKKYATITAVAASVALLIAFAWTFTGIDETGNGGLADASHPKNLVPENYVKRDPLPVIDTTRVADVVVPEGIAREIPKNPQPVKPPQNNEVIMNDDEIIAQSDLMDESLVIEFVTENNLIEPSEEELDPALLEYLMNDDTSLDIFDPADKKKK